MESPWKRNIDDPYDKTTVSLKKLSTPERLQVNADIAETAAIHEIMDLYRTLGSMDGQVKDFVFASLHLSEAIMTGTLKFLQLQGELRPEYLTGAYLITAKMRKDVVKFAEEAGVPFDREIK